MSDDRFIRQGMVNEIARLTAELAACQKERDEFRDLNSINETAANKAFDVCDDLRALFVAMQAERDEARAELAAERERSRSAARREGNLRDHIVHLGGRVAKLREALEKSLPYVRDAAASQGADYSSAAIIVLAAIDAVMKETKP